MDRKIDCSIVTSDSVFFEGQVDLAVVPAFDGEVGFLYNHAPFISKLGYGEVRLQNNDTTEYLIVEGGFVEINKNELIILAENAFNKKDLIKDEIEKEITELKDKKNTLDKNEEMILDVEIKKRKARLKVALR